MIEFPKKVGLESDDSRLMRIATPREIELQEKEKGGHLTKEEEGELRGLRGFPTNPRGQELLKKETIGTLSSDEKEELRRLRQLRHRQETMTLGLRELWERVEAHDPNVVQIGMNDGGY